MSEAPEDPNTPCADCGHERSMHRKHASRVASSNDSMCNAVGCKCYGFITPAPLLDDDVVDDDDLTDFEPRTAPFEFSVDLTSLLGEQPTNRFRVTHSIPVPPASDTTGTFPPYRGRHADYVITLFRVDCMIDAMPLGRREAWARLLWGMVLEPIVGGTAQGTFIPEQRRVVCEECLLKLKESGDTFVSAHNPHPEQDHPELLRAYVEMHPDMNVRESGILVPWRHRFEVKLTWDNPENSEPIPIGALRVVVKGLYIEHEDDPWD